ncbi:P-loop containing nucleoside triphosphate hydrolase protein [Nemania abortiva]|nr:P-loop containing nucleoside triphosphate hydrolase protein [Nemania abortiva]
MADTSDDVIPNSSPSAKRLLKEGFSPSLEVFIKVDALSIMGATGSGKSRFINLASGQVLAEVGDSLSSCTKEVQESIFRDRDDLIAIIDTPGFNDTNMSDTKVLRLIAAYLQATYESNLKLAGVLYLYDITETRMTGAAKKNLDVLIKLVGEDSFKNVVLVTTKWDKLNQESEEGELREKQLRGYYDDKRHWHKGFWSSVIDDGALYERHDGTHESALNIARTLIGKETVLQIQQEVAVQGLELSKTAAGMGVERDLERILKEISMALETEHDEGCREVEERLKKSEEDRKALSRSRVEEMETLRGLLSGIEESANLPLIDLFWATPGSISQFLKSALGKA